MAVDRALTVRQDIAPAEQTKAVWATGINNPEHARALAIIGQHYDLDPALGEVVILGNKVYVTLEGYLTIASRQPQYDGYELWPLSEEERKAMMIGAGEHAWGARVWRKDRRYPAVGYGRASTSDVQMSTIHKFLPEQAQKRALHRAMRGAFRVNMPDPDEDFNSAIGPVHVVDAATPDEPPKPLQPDWSSFWVACKGIGANKDDVHTALGVASVKDWQGSLQEAYQRVESWIVERDRKPAAMGPTFTNDGELWTAVQKDFGLSKGQAMKQLGYSREQDLTGNREEIYQQIKGIMRGE